MSEQVRRKWAEQAGRDLANGDERLATLLVLSAARQSAAVLIHYADQIATTLRQYRDHLACADPLVLRQKPHADELPGPERAT